MKRIGILVVAYNAASTLATVLDRIPQGFRSHISEVLVCDDFSQDSTYLVGLGYKQLSSDLPLTVIRQPRNLGYGGNQKSGYQWAIEHDLDIVVLLHGDGQYAPEFLPEIVAPLERGECDAVFGSRMMEPGGARPRRPPVATPARLRRPGPAGSGSARAPGHRSAWRSDRPVPSGVGHDVKTQTKGAG